MREWKPVGVFFVTALLIFAMAPIRANGLLGPDKTVFVDQKVYPHFNWASFDQDKVVSLGHYQYSTYWDSDKTLVVVRRDRRTDEVQTVRMPEYRLSSRDGHRNTVVGISPVDGRLHLSWDHHNNPLHYTKSRTGFVTDPPVHISPDDFEPEQELTPDAPQSVTYPRFVTDRQDHLFFTYRSGYSGNGRTVLARYQADTGQWRLVGDRVFAPDGNAYKPWDNSKTRNPYFHDILFGPEGRLHTIWTYREAGRSWASNHDLHYAYSPDGGVIWKNNDGQVIGDLGDRDPVDLADPGIVVQHIPVFSWLMNQCSMTVDSRGCPHVCTYHRENPYRPEELHHGPPAEIREQLRFHHYWRDPDGTWHSSGPLESKNCDMTPMSRPHIVTDEEDNLYMYWSTDGGFLCYVSFADRGWREGVCLRLTGPRYRVNDATKHDRRLLRRKGILSFTADPQGGRKGKGFAFLDFDIKRLRRRARELAAEW